MSSTKLSALIPALRQLQPNQLFGRVTGVRGQCVEVGGLGRAATLGARLLVQGAQGEVELEATALAADRALCMAFGPLDGLAIGARADLLASQASVSPCDAWLGRVIDGLGRPIDGKGPLLSGGVARLVRGSPPPAHRRARVGAKIETGVTALDIFAPLCRGQRVGLFAGSGVGKSVLLSMLARYTACDVAVIGLIGERGREVQEFLQEELGEEGLARSVVVVATSDEPALLRRQAAYLTLAVAEHFRDAGRHVLCMMDSVTRFAMAQREIGLASGEPPATKGYTPTVFAELPRLLERAGPGCDEAGAITGLFTVLVEGGDHDEPVADAVRGILDGHVVMQRAIAERGRYPAINPLKSVSRTLPGAHDARQNGLLAQARALLTVYGDMEEMIRLGAYRQGSNPEVDRAIALAPRIEALITQSKHQRGESAAAFDQLEALIQEQS